MNELFDLGHGSVPMTVAYNIALTVIIQPYIIPTNNNSGDTETQIMTSR